MKIAAIDIGSNAIRLLIKEFPFGDNTVSNKLLMVRLPVRMGEEVFISGEFSFERIELLTEGMNAYASILKVYKPDVFRVCATSAFREASNREKVIKKIEKQTGLQIEVISGEEEASLIYGNIFAEEDYADKTILSIDIGGGSTEMAFFHKGEPVLSRSFDIGTLRIKHDIVEHKSWQIAEKWLLEVRDKFKVDFAVSSGGTVRKLCKMAESGNAMLHLNEIREIFWYLKGFSLKEKMEILKLGQDRADVISPAGEILLRMMELSGVEKVTSPKLGLADGIIRQLYLDGQD